MQGQDASAHYRLICELSSRLLDRPRAEWDTLLDRDCGADSELRAQVLKVCNNYSDADDFFGISIVSPLILEDSLIGERIGAWRVLSVLGEGGMGRVFLVERADGVFTQLAALKVIRNHSDPASVQKFEAERRILALLEHPSIARAIDGGATFSGVPYLVMEYVEGGRPIDEFCQPLPVKEKIRLFLQVVEAVDKAHQLRVAHRDLKPANILVGSAGVPKILDFGIAKLFQDESLSLDRTNTVHAALTPTYASPEQLLREPSTPSSDLYSLGAVLYRMLTGHPPHDLSGLNLLQSIRKVTESDPLPPSQRNPEVDAQADAIVMKAIERSPANRYQTASEFAADLHRYLKGAPVKARRSGRTDRAKRFVRQRPFLAFTAAACLLLALAPAASFILGRRADTQRLDHLRKTARPTISEFKGQLAMLTRDPLRLDRVAAGEKRYLDAIAADAAKDPDLRRLVASAYGSLATFPLLDKFTIEDSLIKSMALWRQVSKQESTSADRLEMAAVWRRLGSSRIDMGKLAEAGRSLDTGMGLLDSLSESESLQAGRHERVIMLLELSRLNAWVGNGRGAIDYAQKAAAQQEALAPNPTAANGSDYDIFELTVNDGATAWNKTFPAASPELKLYAASVRTKHAGADGPVAFSFQTKSGAGNAPILETAVQPGEPPPCVRNVAGVYQWTTDNRSTTLGNGKFEHVGVVKLTSDHNAVTQAGEPLRNVRAGVWRINNDCLVTINWQNGRYIDILTLSNDGNHLTGTSQIGTIITGTK